MLRGVGGLLAERNCRAGIYSCVLGASGSACFVHRHYAESELMETMYEELAEIRVVGTT